MGPSASCDHGAILRNNPSRIPSVLTSWAIWHSIKIPAPSGLPIYKTALGGRYVVGPKIAVGGQGAVFRATRTSRQDGTAASDDIALKLHLYPSQDVRVQREVAAMENVAHPNLARLIEHGYCDVATRHTRYVAWKFVEGELLSVWLNGGPLLECETLAIGCDVSAAIAHIWSRRIVHGDIKPSNIMLRNSDDHMTLGSVVSAILIDLGAARYLDQDDAHRTLTPSRYGDPTNTSAILKPMEHGVTFRQSSSEE